MTLGPPIEKVGIRGSCAPATTSSIVAFRLTFRSRSVSSAIALASAIGMNSTFFGPRLASWQPSEVTANSATSMLGVMICTRPYGATIARRKP